MKCPLAGHPRARRVTVSNTWLQAKARDILNHKRDHLLAGYLIEDVFPGYDITKNVDACLQVTKFGKRTSLAIQVTTLLKVVIPFLPFSGVDLGAHPLLAF